MRWRKRRYGDNRSLLQKFRELPWYKELGIFAAVTLVLSLFVWIGYGLLGRERQVSTIELFSWQRVVNIQDYATYHYNKTKWKKSGAFNVRTWTEMEYHLMDEEWESVRYYEYDRNEWRHFRSVVAAGNDHNPYWPDYKLGMGPLGKQNQVSDTPESYSIHVVNDEGERRVFECPQSTWDRYEKGETVIAVLNGFGSVQELDRLEVAE